MTYKNSFKLLLSNFSLIYKVLIFLLINLVIIFGISYVLVLPVINLLSNANWFANIENVYISFINQPDFNVLTTNLNTILTDFISVISNNLSVIGVNIIFFALTLFVLGSFLNGFYNLIISNVLYYYMSNNLRFGFMSSFIETFTKNIKYNLISLTTKLPVTLIIYTLLFLIFRLFTVYGGSLLLMFFVLILVYIVLKALKVTLFSSWAPSMLVFNKGVVKDIFKGISITNRRFWKVYSNAFYIVLTLFIVNVFSAIVTFGFSLFFTVPISVVVLSCFNMVAFYSNYGMRYYVDEFNVIVPKKMADTDKASSIKHII